jgi:hypothetical protein
MMGRTFTLTRYQKTIFQWNVWTRINGKSKAGVL